MTDRSLGHRDSNELFVGRSAELRQLDTLLTDLGVASPCAFTYVRGIGGAGKTWFTRRALYDALAGQQDSFAVHIDCSSIVTSDLVSVLRLLARALDSSVAAQELIATVDRIEHVTTLLRQTSALPDCEPSDVQTWDATKAAALESLTFLTSAALESHLVGQATSSASSAVVASLRAMTYAARDSTNGLRLALQRLRSEGAIDDQDVTLIQDAESAIARALGTMLKAARPAGHLFLWFDKSETMAPSLYRLVELLTSACTSGTTAIIFSGQITTIRTPSGDSLSPVEHLEQATSLHTDIELGALDEADAKRLIELRYERRHGAVPPAIPNWLSQQVVRVTKGTPLWLSFMVEDIVRATNTDWTTIDPVLYSGSRRMRPILRRIVGGASDIASTDATYRLLIALAIAPERTATASICRAAGQDSRARLDAISGAYSFMNGDRLHDAVRSAMRTHIASDPDDRPIAGEVATLLRAELRFDAEEFWPSSPTLQVVDEAVNDLDLCYWSKVDEATTLAISHAVVGFSRGAHWIADVLLVAAWHLAHVRPSEEVRKAFTQASRLCSPALFASQASRGLTPERSRLVFKSAMAAATNTAGTIVLIGRCLVQIETYFARSTDVLPLPRLTLLCERLRWLAHHGFDDEVVDATAAALAQFDALPVASWLRGVAGSAIANSLTSRIELAYVDDNERRVSTLKTTDALKALIKIHPASALPLFRSAQSVVGLETISDEAKALADGFRSDEQGQEGLQYCLVLANTCFDLALYEQAHKMFAETLKRSSDLLVGWLGRSRTLWARGRVTEAVQSYRRGLGIAHAFEPSKLSKPALDACASMVTEAALLELHQGRVEAVHELVSEAPGDIDTAYATFMVSLFRGELEEATMALQRCVNRATNPDYFVVELALLQVRQSPSDGPLQLLAGPPPSASHLDALIEGTLISAARSAGWVPSPMIEADREGGDEGAS